MNDENFDYGTCGAIWFDRCEDGRTSNEEDVCWARCTIERVAPVETTTEPAEEQRTEAETAWYLRGLRRGRMLGIVDAKDAIDGKLGNVTLDVLLRDNLVREMRED